MGNQATYVRKSDSGWEGVEREGYVPGEQTRVVRNTLVGARKEVADDPGPSLELRYFEVPPGAVTRLEKHAHEHFVIVGEGDGIAVVGTEARAVKQHDVVYVAPLVPHQFVNRSDRPFGFFCIVDAARDYSQLLSSDELSALARSPAGPFVDPDGAPPAQAPATKRASTS